MDILITDLADVVEVPIPSIVPPTMTVEYLDPSLLAVVVTQNTDRPLVVVEAVHPEAVVNTLKQKDYESDSKRFP